MRTFDASANIDLEPAALILAELDRTATAQGIEIMVVGATARDIMIRHVIGSAPQRATADIDIAVCVDSWSAVHELTGALTSTGRSTHMFLVHDAEVDIIPFGAIETPERTITWPDDHLMDVFGFQEALTAAVRVTFPGNLTVAVASLPAQSLLKLLAWRDRRHTSRRDAVDLKSILSAYSEGPYLDALYEEHGDLLDMHDFDPVLAGAARVGQEACALIAAVSRRVVTDLLDSRGLLDALAEDMPGSPAWNHSLVAAYRGGFG